MKRQEKDLPLKKERKLIRPAFGARSFVTGEEYIDPNEAYYRKQEELEIRKAQENSLDEGIDW